MTDTARYLPHLLGPVVLQANGDDQTPAANVNFAGMTGSYDAETDTTTFTPSGQTLASPTVTGTVTFQGTRLRILSIPGEVSTADDTVTTLASFAMLDETLCAFDVVVTAASKTTVTIGGRWKRSIVYRRTGGGVATIVGAIETGTDQETDAELDVNIDTDGAEVVRVRVTGIAATDLNWTCELRVQETLSA